MRDINGAEEWLDHWTAGVGAQAERAARLARAVSTVDATARNGDRTIAVTVDAAGQVIDLQLDERLTLGGPALAREILRVMRAAQSRLAAQVAEHVRDTVGVDTETGRAVVGAYERRFPEPVAPPRDAVEVPRVR